MADVFKEGFFRTLWILRDYLPELVIGGGWAPLIYHHYLIGDKSSEPIRTKDIDILVPEKLPVIGAKKVDELLLEAGLEPVFRSRGTPPVVSYEGDIDGYEVEIEFLTDQSGAKDAVVVRVQDGLNAQSLRYISILTDNAIEVEVDDFYCREKLWLLTVRVPSPASYIFHKGLIFTRRNKEQKKTKDLYYIFDILANCPELHEEIYSQLKGLKGAYHLRWFETFARNLKDHFSDILSDGIDLVASQRPTGAFPGLDDGQFKQYVLETFKDFIGKLELL